MLQIQSLDLEQHSTVVTLGVGGLVNLVLLAVAFIGFYLRKTRRVQCISPSLSAVSCLLWPVWRRPVCNNSQTLGRDAIRLSNSHVDACVAWCIACSYCCFQWLGVGWYGESFVPFFSPCFLVSTSIDDVSVAYFTTCLVRFIRMLWRWIADALVLTT